MRGPRVETDGRSFEQALVALRPALLKLAVHLARSPSDAEDLVQDTLERALRHRHRFTPGSRLGAWTRRILRNAFLDHVRTQQRRRMVALGETAPAELPAAEPRIADVVPPWRWVDAEQVQAALAEVPEGFRRVVEMHDLEGWSRAEVAQTLAHPPATVGTRLHPGRQRLRTRFGKGLPIPLRDLKLEYESAHAA